MRIPYRVYAYAVGPPQAQSIAAGAYKTLETDLPAVLILCEDETDQAKLIHEVYERGRTHAPNAPTNGRVSRCRGEGDSRRDVGTRMTPYLHCACGIALTAGTMGLRRDALGIVRQCRWCEEQAAIDESLRAQEPSERLGESLSRRRIPRP